MIHTLSKLIKIQLSLLPLLITGNLYAGTDCQAIPQLDWPGVAVASSVPEAAPVGLCKVSGTIDGSVNFELYLPENWNGKFVFGGGGGFVGAIDNQVLNYQALQKGYATVGTDTGHQASGIDASWAQDDMRALVNYGHWAVHRTAEVSKALIRTHYGKPSSTNYFVGCSNGGRQAMMSAQRYPQDFDGIAALAPAMNFAGIGAHFAQIQQVMYPDPNDLETPVLTPAALELVEQRSLAACDALDGVEDGLLGDPRRCEFNFDRIEQCSTNGQANCLTAAQRQALDVIYGGAHINGKTYFPGFPFGAESVPGSWDLWITGSATMPPLEEAGAPSLTYAFGTQMMKHMLYHDPEWDYSKHDWSSFESDAHVLASIVNATDTDLTAFDAAGGKLLLWHGWADPALTAFDSIDYFEAVEANDPQVRDYLRLFLSPGVLHCFGGPGASLWNPLDEIERWVEKGQAPERIETWFVKDGKPSGSRPICAYPQQAVYKGSGDIRTAASFECR